MYSSTGIDEFLDILAKGQLKNASCTENGLIIQEKVPELVSYVNQGLTDICVRQTIITRTVDLIFLDDKKTYEMVLDAYYPYLNDDDTDPFSEYYFIRFLEIIDAEGKKHFTDTNGHIMTPEFNTLRFTSAKIRELGPKIRIKYQARHPWVTSNVIDYMQQGNSEVGQQVFSPGFAPISTQNFIKLPPNMLTALQIYVASLYLSHIGGEESSRQGERYFATYLRYLGFDEEKDLSSTSETMHDDKLSDRGFV